MNVFTASLKLKNKDVNLFRRLRTSRLLEIVQEASIAHTEELHMGRSMTLDKGLLWVVVQQRFEITAMPEYDEQITVETWPGRTRHVLFPRFYRILNGKGDTIISGSALWMLVEEDSRRMVFPSKHGIEINEVITGNETALPETIRMPQTEETKLFSVPFSVCDLNGHMNNTRYLDLCEDLAGDDLLKQTPVLIETEYLSEVRLHDEIRISWKQDEHSLCVSGEKEKICFRIRMNYGD